MNDSAPAFLTDAARHEEACRALADKLQLRFVYDPVYYAASATVEADEVDRVSAALGEVLPNRWDSFTLRDAKADVKELIAWAGGLRGAQRLMHGDIGVTTLFATLWPWTDDDGCTLRVGCWHARAGVADRGPLGELVKGWLVSGS